MRKSMLIWSQFKWLITLHFVDEEQMRSTLNGCSNETAAPLSCSFDVAPHSTSLWREKRFSLGRLRDDNFNFLLFTGDSVQQLLCCLAYPALSTCIRDDLRGPSSPSNAFSYPCLQSGHIVWWNWMDDMRCSLSCSSHTLRWMDVF